MKFTIHDIAKITGYSASTVSRALNNSGYCDAKTRSIIIKKAKELNYKPSNAGRVLKSQKSKRILFCIPDILNPFYFEMIRGTTEYLTNNNYYSILCYTMHDEEQEVKYLNLLSEHYADGMIMVSFNFTPKLVELIRSSSFPIVTTNMVPNRLDNDNFDIVYIDHVKAIYIATEYLINNGHRDIAIVVGNLKEQTSKERLEGFKMAMRDNKINYNENNIFIGDYTINSGKILAEKIAKSKENFTAIVSSNDLMSMGIVSRLQDMNYNIPKDYSIISLDNTDYADAIHPGLTSVDMRQFDLGNTSSKLLLDALENDFHESKVIRLEPKLVIRDSVRHFH